MSNFKATFLGTGTSQGVPVISCKCGVCQSVDSRDNRLRTSLLISVEGKNIVIDTGPDFRQQMLNNRVDSVDAVLFTHEHKDHLAGLDDIRPFNFKSKSVMPIYATTAVQEALKREFHYAFGEKKYPGVPQLELHTIADEPFEIFGEKIIPVNVLHYKLPVKAFRLRNFTYITDANYISDEEFEKLKGTEVLVINALRKEKHLSHFSLEEALAFIDRLAPKRAYLTHISHLMGRHKEVTAELPRHVKIAHDGLVIDCE
ncbi:MAG: MBL fold metallo-hydrolase [Crocinitomicaceae bacterium]